MQIPRAVLASALFTAAAFGYAAGNTTGTAGAVDCPPPPTGTIADEFSGTTLGSAWREVDPMGDGTVTVTGGELRLAITSAYNHDNWPQSGQPVNRTLRVVRSLPSGDWTIETKILNADINAGRFAGFLIESDASHFIRSDWDGDGTRVELYVAVWSGGTSFAKKANVATGNNAVQWQRIRKQGTTYTVSTSTNGTSWTTRATFVWSPTPRLVGLNVGNSGTRPSYTARFDYVR